MSREEAANYFRLAIMLFVLVLGIHAISGVIKVTKQFEPMPLGERRRSNIAHFDNEANGRTHVREKTDAARATR